MRFKSFQRPKGRWSLGGSALRLAVVALLTWTLASAEESSEPPSAADLERLPPAAEIEIDFERDILPIFKRSCYECHGPRETSGGLRLHVKKIAHAGGDSGPAFIPGNSEQSRMIWNTARISGEPMPPPEEGDPLTRDEIALLRAWIDQGAPWSGESAAEPVQSDHWSFQPLRRPALPQANRTDWARNPIDAFVLARLQRNWMKPSPEAEKVTLIRRLSLDLLGLAPTPAEVNDFVADDGEFAYERLVRRLLASPHFGERWARHWLDLARYADSDGFEKDTVRPHAWRYRQWVIEAFNRDLPYDRFVIEQLAGDLLPDATTEQKVATGFHRNTLTNKEGGVDQEEYRVEQVVDRTNTTGSVFLGLTVGCAQCHSHKYDPLTHREYYGLFAFFNAAIEKDVPAPLAPELEAYRIAGERWEREHRQFEQAIRRYRPELTQKAARWEAALALEPVQWTPIVPVGFISAGGASFEVEESGAVRVTGESPASDTYTLVANTDLNRITAFRLEALTDEARPESGPGRSANGNFVLNRFSVSAGPRGEPDSSKQIKLATAWADYSQDRFAVAGAIDDKRDTGWAIEAGKGTNVKRTAVFAAEDEIAGEQGATLTIKLGQHYGEQHTLARFRISVTASAAELVRLPADVLEALLISPSERTEEQTARIVDHHATMEPESRRLAAALEGHRRAKPRPPETKAQTMARNPEPPKTHVHVRGDFLRKGAEVTAHTPAFLPPLEAGGDEADRLDLARWIVDPDNPLSARVAVNRIWEHLFGRGIVLTSEDFGTRGEPPSHPELLDWLASEFISRGWSTKETIYLIATSATYRQASHARPDYVERDPANRLLARQNRFRVEGEIARDLFLAASGLLDRRVGGASVRPPLPEGVAELGYAGSVRWTESKGGDRYRRGIYTFFQRTVPYPMLMTFDCPDSNVSVARRGRSNTPLQALTLLNDPVFVECARAFGRGLLDEEGEDDSERLVRGFRIALGREPSQTELAVLAGLLEDQRLHYEMRLAAAEELAGEGLPEGLAVSEAAAWVSLGRTILNLDEFLTRE